MLKVESTVPGLNWPLSPLLSLGLRICRRDHDLVQQLDARDRDAVLNQVSRRCGGGRDRREGRNGNGRGKEGSEFECSCRFECISSENVRSVNGRRAMIGMCTFGDNAERALCSNEQATEVRPHRGFPRMAAKDQSPAQARRACDIILTLLSVES